jgi:hypothetical protein
VKVYFQYEIFGNHSKEPVDWIIKVENTIITIIEAKKKDINQSIAQNTVILQTSIQCNSKKHNYNMADLYKDMDPGNL